MLRTALLTIVFFLPAFNHLRAARFQILGPISRPYGEKSVFVSNDGSVVLATTAGTHERDGFLWTVSQGIISRFPRTSQSRPLGISGDGRLIVGTDHGSAYYPPTTYSYDASFDGSVVVGYRSLGYPRGEAFRAISGGATIGLGDLPGGEFASVASAVSADGNTVVGSSWGTDWFQPFRWTADEGMVSLGALPGATSSIGKALDVSGDGSVVVGEIKSSHGGWEAFRWTPSTGLQGLGNLRTDQADSTAYGVSADGEIIVGRGQVDVPGTNTSRAFIWDSKHGMRNLEEVLQDGYGLDLQGVTLNVATSTSADGRVIVGWGMKEFAGMYDSVAWRVVIPEPSTAIISTPGLLLVGLALRMRRA